MQTLTLTDNLALFSTLAGGRKARTWARRGQTIELVSMGSMWTIRYNGREYTAVPRVVMAATA